MVAQGYGIADIGVPMIDGVWDPDMRPCALSALPAPNPGGRLPDILDRIDATLAMAAAGHDAAAMEVGGHGRDVNLPRNGLLRRARLRRVSPSGSGRPMSRQELADLVNTYLAKVDIRHTPLDGGYVGKLERGVIRWPQQAYREAFRTVFNTATDAELGFYIRRRADTY